MELQRNILESSNIKLRSLLCLHVEDTSSPVLVPGILQPVTDTG